MPRQLFDQALDLLLKKDMAGFAGLWAEDGRMEFPFAPASWPAEVNVAGIHTAHTPPLQGIPWRQVHETADPRVVVAEFDAAGEVVATGKPYRVAVHRGDHRQRGPDRRVARRLEPARRAGPVVTVLVIGGTGTTGSRVTRRLGDEARIASRSTGFDWYDQNTYAPALDGTRAVDLIPPVRQIDPAPHVERFLEMAGGRRVVLLSSSALPPNPNAELVRRLPEWAVLRPSWFMQNFTGNHPVAQGVAAGEIVTATGDGRVAFVDADDIAAVAVKALTGTPHNAEQ